VKYKYIPSPPLARIIKRPLYLITWSRILLEKLTASSVAGTTQIANLWGEKKTEENILMSQRSSMK
jgi:hypothetical protein